MKLPPIETVENWLSQGFKENPGIWVKHSYLVGNAAKVIAENTVDLYPYQAYIMGLVHDIGKKFGSSQERHTIDGYHFLLRLGYEELARVCITHCFPTQNVYANVGKWDCDNSELNFIKSFLAEIEYNDYDRLIQMCDCLVQHDKYVLMEKRLFDVALRYCLADQSDIKLFVLQRWSKYLQIRKYFNKKLGKSVYHFLPNVVENTFDFSD
ncbi:MAG: phosphohydrolase [Candidatus Heimdallarchaeota archaeon]|nr:phosphohydrolase [Candidatus Heimdallarchaeota archaeon]